MFTFSPSYVQAAFLDQYMAVVLGVTPQASIHPTLYLQWRAVFADLVLFYV